MLARSAETQTPTDSGHDRARSTSRTIVIESDAPELLLMKTLEKIIGEKVQHQLTNLTSNRARLNWFWLIWF